ncbi:MAG: hypothetical protein MZV64_42325 [Ignavibacteriales bacterium]|nr:hypothetical protein [Ignavibacteriales bacterium]
MFAVHDRVEAAVTKRQRLRGVGPFVGGAVIVTLLAAAGAWLAARGPEQRSGRAVGRQRDRARRVPTLVAALRRTGQARARHGDRRHRHRGAPALPAGTPPDAGHGAGPGAAAACPAR